MFTSGSPSLADIAAVTGGKNNDGGGFGGDGNGIWVIIILLALFGGLGGNRGGFGGGANNDGGGHPCATNADVQRGFDTANLERQIQGVQTGICSLAYDQLAQMNGINSNIMQTGFTLSSQINQDTIASMQGFNAASRQAADCCCENRAAIAQVRYDMATDTCAVTTAISNSTRDIIDNANCNARAIQDQLTQIQIAAKDEKIAEQANVITVQNLAASQAAQNNYLIQMLRPAPTPAYQVPNPYNGCGCNPCNPCCN